MYATILHLSNRTREVARISVSCGSAVTKEIDQFYRKP